MQYLLSPPCVLSLVFLTIKDMHDQANPVIHEVETGIYNLTSNDLEVAVADVDDYIFFTNNEKIEISVVRINLFRESAAVECG